MYMDEDIHFIMRQTNYTLEETREKLVVHNNNRLDVIKEYMGIPIQKTNPQIKSLNQEIYKQIRRELDVSMKNYNEKNPINIDHAIQNFKESDQKQN